MIRTVEELLEYLREDSYRRLHWNLLKGREHVYEVSRLGDENFEEVALEAGRMAISSGFLLETDTYVYKYDVNADQFDYR